MVDYQIYQTWASILQAVFTAVIAFFTIALVYLTRQYSKATKQYADATDIYVETTKKMLEETANYAQTTEEMLEASIIDRKIRYYEKRLEKLYMPIHNSQKLFESLPTAIGETSIAIEEFVSEIKPYTYLVDGVLQTNLEKILNESGTLFSQEAIDKRNSEEYIKLKENILKQINDAIDRDRRLLNKMVMEYTIRFRISSKSTSGKHITL